METTIDTPTGLYLTLTRTLRAPRALVFRMWSEPRHLSRWCGPAGFTVLLCEGDFRPGGEWRSILRAADGTEHPLAGRYLEIETDRLIRQTHAWLDAAGNPGPETEITVTLSDTADGTRLDFRQGPFASPQARDGHGIGWGETLDRLVDHVTDFERAAPADEPIIRTTRDFAAPRELVWSALTDPVHISNWWGPRGFSTTTRDYNLTPGGFWRFTMHGPDGTDYVNLVEFREITPPSRLAYDHRGEGEHSGIRFKTSIDLTEIEGGTRLTLTTHFATLGERDFVVINHGAIEGGQDTLARLAEHLGV